MWGQNIKAFGKSSFSLMMSNMEGPPLLVSLTLKKKLLAKLYEILEAINCAKNKTCSCGRPVILEVS